MLEALHPWIHVVGRLLFSMLFIGSGFSHFTQRKEMTGYARSKGLPAPGVSVLLTGAMLVAGGLMVLLGWHPDWGALLLFAFLLPTAFLMHAFWKEEDPETQGIEMAMFMKNVSLAGAALLILYYANEPWPFTL